jgi:hypothetical protein
VTGLFDYHLWEFTIAKRRYGLPMDDISSRAMRLDRLAVLKVLKADPRDLLHALHPHLF